MTSFALPDRGTGAALCAAGVTAAIGKAAASSQSSDRRIGVFMNSFEKISHTGPVVHPGNSYLFALMNCYLF